MTKAEFRKNFPKGHAVPPVLMQLFAFQERLGDWYSGHFQLTGDGLETAIASFDGDKKAASQFTLFGRNTDGFSYGYWLYKGRTLDNAPIVYLGSEGTGWSVLANGLEDFLSLLAVGDDELGFSVPFLTEPEQPSANLSAFRDWLKSEYRIAKPNYPPVVIGEAVRSHPDLQAWLRTWQDEHFPREDSNAAVPTTKEKGKRMDEDIPLSDELKRLLGSPVEEVGKTRLASALSGNPKVKKRAGIEFSAKHHCVIASIFIHSDGDEGFKGYDGELPGGIAFTDSRKAIQKKLGKAAHSGGGTVVHPFGKRPMWDRFDYNSFALHVEYAEDEKAILRMTLMTPDAVPQ